MTYTKQTDEANHQNKGDKMSERLKKKMEEAHNQALSSSKQQPNRSDPFAYARVFSRIMNGLYSEKDLQAHNFTLSL